MTHGHIIFYSSRNKRLARPVHCYTWHDGHRSEAVTDLLELPFNIFKKQKNAFLKANSTPEDLEELKEGNWLYNQSIGFALEDNIDEHPWNHLEVYENYFSHNVFSPNNLSYANWFCQQRFNRWQVVPNVKWCTYPGPDFKVYDCSDGADGYTIEIDFDEEADCDEFTITFTNCLDTLNSHMPNSHFLFAQDRSNVTLNCHYQISRVENKVNIIVPFDAIWCELLWKDVEEAYQRISENNVGPGTPLANKIQKIRNRNNSDDK